MSTVFSSRPLAALMLGLAFGAPLFAASLQPVSRTAPMAPSDAANARSDAGMQALSADGCRSVFVSAGTNLVAGQVDINGGADVFLFDCASNTNTLLSHRAGAPLTVANNGSLAATISRDGRYVAFLSYASDLLPGQQKNHTETDLFLYDSNTGVLRLVNTSASDAFTSSDFGASSPVFSGDGSVLVFTSSSADVIADFQDQNNGPDVFHYTIASGQKRLVSRQASTCFIATHCSANESSGQPKVSNDGRWVAYASSATNLVNGQGDTPGSSDIFLWDANAASNATTLVSHVPASNTTAAGDRSENPTLSGDGNFVAYSSHDSALVPSQSDANADSDVFLWSRATNVNVLASHLPGLPATTDDDGYSGNPVLNADGSLLVFSSVSQEMVTGQVDPASLSDDLFLHARLTGINTLVSHAAGSPLQAGAGSSTVSNFSGDGEFLVFQSRAANLVPGQVDINAYGDALMGDDIYRYTIDTGVTLLVSHQAGQPARAGRFMSYLPNISADGTIVTYLSESDELTAGPDGNDEIDALRWTAATDSNVFLSRRDAAADPAGMLGASEAVVSADGRWVAFVSKARNVYAQLVDDDSENTSRDRDNDVFLLDRDTGVTILVSHGIAGVDVTADNDSIRPRISGDGRYVVFESAAGDLVPGQIDGNGAYDIVLFDRADRSLRLVSRSAVSAAQTGNGGSSQAEISRDGRVLAFQSAASDLVPGATDGNGQVDVFVHDIAANTTRIVSRTAGNALATGNGDARQPTLSADGRYIAYHSTASNHVAGSDLNFESDVFLFDRDASGNPNRLVSRSANSATTAGSGASRRPSLSADGRWVAYLSQADNLLPGFYTDGNSGDDVFVFDRDAVFAPTKLVSRQAGEDAFSADDGSQQISISDDGQRIAFLSDATNLADGQQDSPLSTDLFLFDQSDERVRLVSQSVSSPGLAVGAERAELSGDGSAILFDSRSFELAEGIASAGFESKTWLHLVDASTTVLLSRSVLGPDVPPVFYSQIADISPDGSVSIFLSPSPDIVTFDGNRAFPGQLGLDAFAFERALGAPSVSGPADQSIVEDASTGPLAFTVSDVDGLPADLIVSARSSDVTLFPNGSIVISGTGSARTVELLPALEQSGTATITLRAIDADGNVGVAQFTVTVTLVNDAPQLSLPATVTILEGGNSGLLDFTVDDPDHDENELLLTVSSSDPAIVPASGVALAGGAGNRRIRITPAPNAFGDVILTVSAEDPDGTVGSAQFEVTVINVNDVPTFTKGADVIVAEDAATTVPGWATAIGAGPLESAQALAFEFVGNTNPALFAAGPTVSANGTLAFVPAANQSGLATLSLRLRDDGGIANGGEDTTATQTFTITVTAVNDAPTVLGPATFTVAEDGTGSYAFTVDDVDDGAAAVQVSATSSDLTLLPLAGLVPGGSGSARTLQVTPAKDQFGTVFVQVTARDAANASSTLLVEVEVTQIDEQVDVVTALENGIEIVAPDSQVTWIASVDNLGPDTASGVRVVDAAPAGLANVAWTCDAFDGAACGAPSGTGAVDVLTNLPAGGSVVLTITGTVTAAAGNSIAYGVEAVVDADTVDATPADNLAVDIDAVGLPIFANGFED